MRSGGGKQKGGAYEHTVAKKIAKAFEKFNVTEDDCYRTKNSGATKAQPGDLQLSPALAKHLPALIECKHYRNILLKLGKHISSQPKSYVIKEWWKQVKREEKDSTTCKFGLLVMRQNNVPDVCAFSPSKIKEAFAARKLEHPHLTRYCFDNLIVSRYNDEELWIVPFADFLMQYTSHYKWFVRNGVIE